MIHLYDANNVLRRDFERAGETTTNTRLIYEEANASEDHQIWVWDGYNHNARRRELFPDYKVGRQATGEDIFTGLNLMKEVLSYSKADQIEVAGWEADDVIFSLSKFFSTNGVETTVHTNDLDYYQLSSLPHITLNGVRVPDFDPEYITLYKTLVGDPSDKISGIPGFGPRTFESIKSYWNDLIIAFENNDRAFIRNMDVKPKTRAFLLDDEGMDLLFSFWKIVQMWEVPREEIDKGWTRGSLNPQAAQDIFTRFML